MGVFMQNSGIYRVKRDVLAAVSADAAIDYSAFTPVDIRKWNDVTVLGKRLKVLTAAPSSSYGIVSLGDRNWMLTISSVSDFWRTSRFLII